jgi:hypothetical protein
MSEEEDETRDAYEYVDDLGERCAEVCDDVNAEEAYESPVERTDDDEYKRDYVYSFHILKNYLIIPTTFYPLIISTWQEIG